MNRRNSQVIRDLELTPIERLTLLNFFQENHDKIKTKLALGPVGFQLDSGKVISVFTYQEFLDSVSFLDASTPRSSALH